jgi:hypothetical protein
LVIGEIAAHRTGQSTALFEADEGEEKRKQGDKKRKKKLENLLPSVSKHRPRFPEDLFLYQALQHFNLAAWYCR